MGYIDFLDKKNNSDTVCSNNIIDTIIHGINGIEFSYEIIGYEHEISCCLNSYNICITYNKLHDKAYLKIEALCKTDIYDKGDFSIYLCNVDKFKNLEDLVMNCKNSQEKFKKIYDNIKNED